MEILLNSKLMYKGVVIEVYKEKVLLPNGNSCVMDLARHPGASGIVPVTDDGRIILIRQLRHAAGGYLYEIPAGKLDKKGENPLNCARRELKEETGYSAKKWKKLVSTLTTPGFSNEVIHIYLATELKKGKTSHEHDEIIEIMTFTRAQVKKMIAGQKITDAKTLVGLCLYLMRR